MHGCRYGFSLNDDQRSDKELLCELVVNIAFLVAYNVLFFLLLSPINPFTPTRTGDDYLSNIDLAYWAFVTLTTIGYGDINPTPAERLYVAVWMIYGLAVMSSVLAVSAEFFLKKQEMKMDIIRRQASTGLVGSGGSGDCGKRVAQNCNVELKPFAKGRRRCWSPLARRPMRNSGILTPISLKRPWAQAKTDVNPGIGFVNTNGRSPPCAPSKRRKQHLQPRTPPRSHSTTM